MLILSLALIGLDPLAAFGTALAILGRDPPAGFGTAAAAANATAFGTAAVALAAVATNLAAFATAFGVAFAGYCTRYAAKALDFACAA